MSFQTSCTLCVETWSPCSDPECTLTSVRRFPVVDNVEKVGYGQILESCGCWAEDFRIFFFFFLLELCELRF